MIIAFSQFSFVFSNVFKMHGVVSSNTKGTMRGYNPVFTKIFMKHNISVAASFEDESVPTSRSGISTKGGK